MSLRVTFWGTRGSLPAPGPDTTYYGGNTSCVSVINGEGHQLILDAGSGIRLAGLETKMDASRVDILLTHLHMDHIQGLGFFAPFFVPGKEIYIWGPPSVAHKLRQRLAYYLSPPLFPVRLRELPSRVECNDVRGKTWDVGSYKVSANLVCHPDPTVGYRIEHDGKVLTYLPDHEPQLGQAKGLPEAEWLSGFDLCEGADLLIHDAQYTPEEYSTRIGWGHCTPELAVRLAETVGAKRLALFHHDPTHSDQTLDEICLKASRLHKEGRIDISAAAERDVYEL